MEIGRSAAKQNSAAQNRVYKRSVELLERIEMRSCQKGVEESHSPREKSCQEEFNNVSLYLWKQNIRHL